MGNILSNTKSQNIAKIPRPNRFMSALKSILGKQIRVRSPITILILCVVLPRVWNTYFKYSPRVPFVTCQPLTAAQTLCPPHATNGRQNVRRHTEIAEKTTRFSGKYRMTVVLVNQVNTTWRDLWTVILFIFAAQVVHVEAGGNRRVHGAYLNMSCVT